MCCKAARHAVKHHLRLQVAIGTCYEHEHIRCYEAAAKCYRRAVTSGDYENVVLAQLAKLYVRMEQPDAAFSCFKQNLDRLDSQGAPGAVRTGLGLSCVFHWECELARELQL